MENKMKTVAKKRTELLYNQAVILRIIDYLFKQYKNTLTLKGYIHPHIRCSTSYRFSVAQFSSVQSLSHVKLFVTPWTAASQASLSITSSWTLLSDAEGWGQSLTKIIKIQFYYQIENKSKDRGQKKGQNILVMRIVTDSLDFKRFAAEQTRITHSIALRKHVR